MSVVKEFHDSFYTENILELDEQGNDFSKISSLWLESPEPQSVLDIGCGAGAVTSALVDRGHSVYGIDIQDEAVRRACARGLKAQVADLNEPLPYRNKSFDVVLAGDIIEHLFDPLALLRETRRVLNDRGYAIVCIPHHFDIVQRIRMLFGRGIVTAEHLHYSDKYKPWNYVHIRFFTISEAFELVREAGFVVEKAEYIGVAIFFKRPWRTLIRTFCNRYSRRVLPSLFSGGVRLRVRKRKGPEAESDGIN